MPTATLTRRPAFTVLLEGGPRHLPRRVEVPRKTAMSGKVKVPNGAGWEHFAYVPGAGPDWVFRWVMRTSVAE
ncbi:DUF5988 family protein [Herbidospora cretacea]|uniref:DUF5988 family protein n=1 Tax=Herbidospora cretacea TaxID=28444 RepID=UPI000772F15D|nr:DUF5988 family protein [Herbidospora cretacea]